MKDSQVTNRKITGWLDEFVNSLSSKKDNEHKAAVKEADININDLPKVVWNDETFHVYFDTEKNQANVLNGFGITVQEIPNVSTIEEVDSYLNSKQIIVSSINEDIFEEELKKAAAYIAEADMTNTTPSDPNAAANNQIIQDKITPEVSQPVQPTPVPTPDATQPTEPTSDQPVQASLECGEEPVEDIEEEIAKHASMLDLMGKIAALEDQVNTLNQQVIALQGQEYAHAEKPQQGELDLNVEQTELQHVQEMANATEQEIAQEHQIDLTTPAGRVSLKDKLRDDLNTIMESDDVLTVTEEDLLEKPEMSMEMGIEVKTPVEETPEVPEESVEEVKSEENGDPEVGSNEEVPTENPEISSEEKTEPLEDKPEEEVKPEEEKKEDAIVKLNERDSKIFKKGICPTCGETHIIKANAIGKMVGLYCQDCDSEYAVDTDTEEIYKNNK